MKKVLKIANTISNMDTYRAFTCVCKRLYLCTSLFSIRFKANDSGRPREQMCHQAFCSEDDEADR